MFGLELTFLVYMKKRKSKIQWVQILSKSLGIIHAFIHSSAHYQDHTVGVVFIIFLSFKFNFTQTSHKYNSLWTFCIKHYIGFKKIMIYLLLLMQ